MRQGKIQILPAGRHGSEGTRRALKEIKDPTTGRVRGAVTVIRPGGIDDMHARGRVTDRQKAAADRFEELYRFAHSDGMKGIDYSRITVDCMSGGDNFMGERQVRAVKELVFIEGVLAGGYSLLVEIIIEGATVGGIAKCRAKIGLASQRSFEGYISLRVIEALEQLDKLWNTAVGAGNGMRADAGEKTSVMVETRPVDPYAHMGREELNAHGRKVMAALQRIKDADAKRANDNEPPSGRKEAG